MDFDKNLLLLNESNNITNLILEKKDIFININLKNLVSDIIFLTYFYNQTEIISPIIIYIGAGDSEYINILANLFPNFEYHLYDKLKFSNSLIKNSKLNIYNKEFDVDDYVKWSNFNNQIFFISNISKNFMNIQKTIIEKLNPKYSLLKFDLSIVNTNFFEYYNGLILINPFDTITSTENKLIVSNNNSFKTWNTSHYIKQCYYHNNIIRNIEYTKFNNFYKNSIINDYDNSYLIFIISQYLIKIGIILNYENIECIIKIIKKII